VEECFYALAPVFMILARRRGFAAALAPAAALLGGALIISRLDIRFLQTPAFVMSTTFFGHFAEFFAGVYLALRITRLEAGGTLRAPGQWRTRTGLAGVAILVLAMLAVYRRAPLDEPAIVLINNFLIPVPIAVLYCGLIREDTWLGRVLSGGIAGLLGRSSYSFYLLHMLVVADISVPLLSVLRGCRPAIVAGTLIVTWILSIALFKLYEEPLNLAIRRWLRPAGAIAAQRLVEEAGR
jgi:peptidoglycan/LPS O-acetylase OafA/YrhL